MNKLVRWSSRIYQWMLYAYSKQFREAYGEEMLWFYEEYCQTTFDERGFWGVLQVWLQWILDWGVTVIKDRLRSARYEGVSRMDTHQFNAQLTSTFEVFSRALRNGYNVLQTIEIIADHAPEPTKTAMHKVLDHFNQSDDLLEALFSLETEAQSPHFTRFMDAIRTQLEVGDNLADRLEAVNCVIVDELGDDGWAKAVHFDES